MLRYSQWMMGTWPCLSPFWIAFWRQRIRILVMEGIGRLVLLLK